MTQESRSRPLTLGPVMPDSLYEDRGYRSRNAVLEEGRAAVRLVLENTLPQEGLLAAAATTVTDQPRTAPVRLSMSEKERAPHRARFVGEASTFCLFSEIPWLRPEIPIHRDDFYFRVADDIFEQDRPTNITSGERLGMEIAEKINYKIMETLVDDLRSLDREAEPASDAGLTRILEAATVNQRSRNGSVTCLAHPKTWIDLTSPNRVGRGGFAETGGNSHPQYAETNGPALERILSWAIPEGAVITCGDLRAGMTVLVTPPSFTSEWRVTRFDFEVIWTVTGPDFFTLFASPETEPRQPG